MPEATTREHGRRVMDRAHGTDEWVLNGRLARLLRLLQILDADGGPRVCGRNAYHVVVAVFGAIQLVTAVLSPVGLWWLANDAIALALYAGVTSNFAFGCYKAAMLVAQSRRIRECVDATSYRFMRRRGSGRYARATFVRWHGRTVRNTWASTVIATLVLIVWTGTPCVFPNWVVTVRGARGAPNSAFRMNVFNAFPFVPDHTYNDHYATFYAIESIMLVSFLYTSVVFDVLVLTLCLALSCQLDAVCEAVRSLGYDDTSATQSPLQLCNDHDKKKIQNVIKLGAQINVHNDLKSIIEDHQTVMKKLEDYYNIFRSPILFQIILASSSHVFIWFITAMNLSKGKVENPILNVKLFTVLPFFTYQLFTTCSLFGVLNEKKDELNFSLYSSNWIDMDLKTRNLILCVMKLNNANQLKMKVTNIKIVNLEMFSQTMRLCYSIFSMLVKSKKK